MHMEMRHFLPGMHAHIHQYAIPIGFQPQRLRYLAHGAPKASDFIRRGGGAEKKDTLAEILSKPCT